MTLVRRLMLIMRKKFKDDRANNYQLCYKLIILRKYIWFPNCNLSVSKPKYIKLIKIIMMSVVMNALKSGEGFCPSCFHTPEWYSITISINHLFLTINRSTITITITITTITIISGIPSPSASTTSSSPSTGQT